jgi:putative hydrolase of the HAD superfamily
VSDRTQAVLLDAFGTLVELEPPWARLAPALGIGVERARAAFLAEMAYYREHSHEGTDAQALEVLRRRCARVLSDRLGEEVSVETMMDSIRFEAYDDAEPVLRDLHERGLRLVCVSNWDYALGEVLDRVGLGELLDGVVTSAQVGASKPDPAIFTAALELAGCEPQAALHVGDERGADVAGATAFGLRALLLHREGGGDIASLAELPAHL